MAGKIRHGTNVLDKAGKTYPDDIVLEREQESPYVSRGGEKLNGFLNRFPIQVNGVRFLDVGASTGGFTDCLLQRGAAEAVCVDVGHGQLHYRLRQDPRVRNLERINARHIDPIQLPHPDFPLIVMDLSFISLRKVLPAVWPLLTVGGHLIALVKPQFEAGKADADLGKGVIRDPDLRSRIVRELREWVSGNLAGSHLFGECPSPIKGASGNQEFLCGWINEPRESSCPVPESAKNTQT